MMEFKNFTVTNVDQKEFEATYREINSVLSQLEQSVANMEFDLERAEKQMRAMRKVIEIANDTQDEDLLEIAPIYEKQLKQYEDQSAHFETTKAENKARLDRGRALVEDLKECIMSKYDEETDTVELGCKWKAMIELFHSLFKILTPEEISQMQAQQAQQGQPQ